MSRSISLSDVTGCRVSSDTGRLTLTGRNEAGAEIEIVLPLAMYFYVDANIRRAVYTGIRKQAEMGMEQADSGCHDERVWFQPRTVTAGTLARGPHVLLTVDRGMETEITFRLPPETAEQIAQDLLREAENCKAGRAPQPRAAN